MKERMREEKWEGGQKGERGKCHEQTVTIGKTLNI